MQAEQKKTRGQTSHEHQTSSLCFVENEELSGSTLPNNIQLLGWINRRDWQSWWQQKNGHLLLIFKTAAQSSIGSFLLALWKVCALKPTDDRTWFMEFPFKACSPWVKSFCKCCKLIQKDVDFVCFSSAQSTFGFATSRERCQYIVRSKAFSYYVAETGIVMTCFFPGEGPFEWKWPRHFKKCPKPGIFQPLERWGQTPDSSDFFKDCSIHSKFVCQPATVQVVLFRISEHQYHD